MAGDFQERTSHLLDLIGDGQIEASVQVDQAYAKMQHNNTSYRHTKGKAFYLSDPLVKHHRSWLNEVAKELYYQPMRRLFVAVADDFKEKSGLETPVFMEDLNRSGEPRVKEGGRFVYRGTHRPRLSKAQLKAKTRIWHETKGWGFD